MAYTSGFFDAVDQGGGDYDRVYSAATFAHYFSLLVQNGVFPDPSTGMQVKASTSPDMHVSVQPGSGWVNGYYITVEANAPEQLTVPTANPSLSRIDSVIMGLNYVDREVQLYIKSGAVSASPSAVSLQRDKDLYELELAQITMSAGMASITQASITDMRSNTNRCGIVKGTVDQIDTTDLFAQYDNAFQTWFAGIKAQLSDNVATNLQNQIDTLKTDKVNVSDKASTTQAQAGTDNTKWMTPALVLALYNYRKATSAEASAGTDDTHWLSSLRVAGLLNPVKTDVSNLKNKLGKNKTLVATITSSQTFSPASYGLTGKTIDVFMVAGGGGGGGGSGAKNGNWTNGGQGGQGGQCLLVKGIPLTKSSYPLVIGSGGAGGAGAVSPSLVGSNGANGGDTSGFGITIRGGHGGAANTTSPNAVTEGASIGGAGGGSRDNGSAASLVSSAIYSVKNPYSFDTNYGGAGGGSTGGRSYDDSPAVGGAAVLNGGAGANGSTTTSGTGADGLPGSNATGYGGGGGAGSSAVLSYSNSVYHAGGRGGNGTPGIMLIYAEVGL